MSKTRIGFVGVGGMGQCAHLRNYAALPDCEVVAIAEVRENLGRMVAAKYGVPKSYAHSDDMLSAEKLDGIVASQPFTRHGTLVPELLRAGIPVFTEKPLAGSIEAGQKILDAEKACGSWVMVGYHKRSDPATMYAKAKIDGLKASGELGAMRYVRITMPPGDWVSNGFWDLVGSDDPWPELPGDAPATDMSADINDKYIRFVNYYIHQVNLMRHLLGEDYSVDYVAPNEVVMAVRSASGIAGTIEMAPYSNTVGWQESALVCFERGYVKIDLPAPLVVNRAGRVEIMWDPGEGAVPETLIPTMPTVHAMRCQAENFVAAVRGEMPPLCTASEAMKDLEIARDYIRLVTGY